MKRKDFIRKSILATSAIAAAKLVKGEVKKDKITKQVGFNHLPIMETKTSTTVLHKANTRGHANHGWLNSYHSFSFANYYNPDRMNFGVLRVLNDDQVSSGMGFGEHPHDNMEIISIPLEGALEHKDSMGNNGVIKSGDIQVMSAGTGIRHSEFNQSKEFDVRFLQIWLMPNQKNVGPRYDQIEIGELKKENELYQILSPNKEDQGVWIHQNAWFYKGEFNKEVMVNHKINNANNGFYVFVIEGQVTINNQLLEKRDGYGLWDTTSLEIKAKKGTNILLMEVPMK